MCICMYIMVCLYAHWGQRTMLWVSLSFRHTETESPSFHCCLRQVNLTRELLGSLPPRFPILVSECWSYKGMLPYLALQGLWGFTSGAHAHLTRWASFSTLKGTFMFRMLSTFSCLHESHDRTERWVIAFGFLPASWQVQEVMFVGTGKISDPVTSFPYRTKVNGRRGRRKHSWGNFWTIQNCLSPRKAHSLTTGVEINFHTEVQHLHSCLTAVVWELMISLLYKSCGE